MKLFKTLMFVVALAVSGAALAGPAPVVNLPDQPAVTASGKPLKVDQLKKIIVTAGQVRHWSIMPMQNGDLVASLSWNSNRHTIVAEIAVKPESYSITYKDSINMNYGIKDGQPVIHPRYNQYVQELRDAIRIELMKH